MRAATNHARIVIAPHSYLSDLFWIRKYFGTLEKCVVVIDEAHNFLSTTADEPFLSISFGQPKNQFSLNSDIYREKVNRINNNYPVELILEHLNKYCQTNDIFLVKNIQKDVETILQTINKAISQCQSGKPTQGNWVAEDLFELTSFIDEKISYTLDETIIKCFQVLDQDELKRVHFTVENLSQLLLLIKECIKSPIEFFMVYDPKDTAAKIYALHPKIKLRMRLGKAQSLLFSSATMSPVSDVADMFGCQTALKVKLKHIFPSENYKHFFIAGMNTSLKDEFRDDSNSKRKSPQSEIDESILSVKDRKILTTLFEHALRPANKKNVGIFCNNILMVQQVAELLRKQSEELDIVVLGFITSKDRKYEKTSSWLQEHYHSLSQNILGKEENLNFNDESVAQLFKELGKKENKEKLNKTVVLCAVQGGTLAEGVDYKGDAMEMVITIGLPYPPPSEEILAKIKADYWNMFYEDGRQKAEDLAFKQAAFRKLAQSIGRAHRTPNDKAVVIMVDERLLGIKNTSSQNSSYEFLNLKNAGKNLSLLQTPVQVFSENIVIKHLSPNDISKIKNHIKRKVDNWPGVLDEDLISFSDMETQIEEFYSESQSI